SARGEEFSLAPGGVAPGATAVGQATAIATLRPRRSLAWPIRYGGLGAGPLLGPPGHGDILLSRRRRRNGLAADSLSVGRLISRSATAPVRPHDCRPVLDGPPGVLDASTSRGVHAARPDRPQL